MRSIWKGTVSFGLVSIGVKMYSATEERDVSFHQVRRTDGSRIRYKRVAEADGEEVAYADIAKGYALPSGEIVVLTDEDFADLPLASARVVDVVQFVPLDQVDPIYFSKSYYLEPEAAAVKAYVLLREALESSGMAGLVKVAIRSREQLAVLRVRAGVIVLETMIWPDEIRQPDFAFLEQDVAVRPQERKMAESLVASMVADFDPNEYADDYRAALQQVIEAKAEGHAVAVPGQAASSDSGNVVDLMAALRASVDAAKRSRGEPEEPATGQAADHASATEPAGKTVTTVKTVTAGKGPAGKTVTAGKASAGKASAGKSPAGRGPAAKASAAKRAGSKEAVTAVAPKDEVAAEEAVAKAAPGRRRSA
jgi:DNA end-binding protein Ku